MEQEKKKNLCGQIPESLHKRLMENKPPEMNLGDYLARVLTAHLAQTSARQEQRTLAVQVSDDLFQQIKRYLDAPKPLTQKAMMVDLLEQAMRHWQQGTEPLNSADLLDSGKERTLAFTVPENLFEQVEQYLDSHAGMSKRAFLVGVIAEKLRGWEMEQQSQHEEPDEAQAFEMTLSM